MSSGGVTVAPKPVLALKQPQDSLSCMAQRQTVALPLHVQTLQRALNIDRLLDQVEKVLGESLEDSKDGYDILESTKTILSQTSVENRKRRKTRQYNFSHVTEERKWVKVSQQTVNL